MQIKLLNKILLILKKKKKTPKDKFHSKAQLIEFGFTLHHQLAQGVFELHRASSTTNICIS